MRYHKIGFKEGTITPSGLPAVDGGETWRVPFTAAEEASSDADDGLCRRACRSVQ